VRGFIALCIIAFCAGLGVVVGNRMSSEAMAVVVGVVCGVLAGIPTAVLMLVAMRARDRRGGERGRRDGTPLRYVPDYERPPAQYPPVIVVGGVPQPFDGPFDGLRTSLGTPQVPPARDAGAVEGAWREMEEPRRAFRVIGEDD